MILKVLGGLGPGFRVLGSPWKGNTPIRTNPKPPTAPNQQALPFTWSLKIDLYWIFVGFLKWYKLPNCPMFGWLTKNQPATASSLKKELYSAHLRLLDAYEICCPHPVNMNYCVSTRATNMMVANMISEHPPKPKHVSTDNWHPNMFFHLPR